MMRADDHEEAKNISAMVRVWAKMKALSCWLLHFWENEK